MKKIKTFFKKNPNDLSVVIDEVADDNTWVFEYGIPTRKFDGTSCAIIEGKLYKRYDAKVNKKTGKKRAIPVGAIPCQDADKESGHHPHWVECVRSDKSNKYHFVAFDLLETKSDGTYELCGEKVQGNPEKIRGHELIEHGSVRVFIEDYSFQGIRNVLERLDIEGIVFHHRNDGRMCKIRKSDFKIKR